MNAADVIARVARRLNVTVEDIRGPSRKPAVMRARIEAARGIKGLRHLEDGVIARLLNRSKWQVRYYLNDDYCRQKNAASRRWHKDNYTPARKPGKRRPTTTLHEVRLPT